MSAHVTFVKNSVLAIALLGNLSRGYVAARSVPNQQERRAVVPGRASVDVLAPIFVQSL